MGCHKCLVYTRMLIYLSTILIHVTNMVVILNSFTDDVMEIKGLRDFYDTQFFFFTCWTFTFQIAYAAFAFFCDGMSLRDTEEKKTVLPEFVTNFRDKVFSVVVWPSALLTASFFWTIYAYDRNLVYPEYFDKVVTPTSNHVMHTLIAPIVMCEIVLYPRRKPESSVVWICCTIGLEALYFCILYYVHFTKDIWIYPIFATLDANKIYLVICVVATALSLIVFYYLQFFMGSIVLKCREKIGQRFCKACRK